MLPPLLALLSAPPMAAHAAAEDIVLELRLVEPLGTPLVDARVALPYREVFEVSLGVDRFVVEVFAELEMESSVQDAEVEVAAVIQREGAAGVPVRVASPVLTLRKDARQRAVSNIQPTEPVIGHDGRTMDQLSWTLEGSWSEGLREPWIDEVRAAPLEPGLAVLAWADATLASAGDAEARGRLRKPLEERQLGPGALMAFEVVEDKGEVVTVKSLSSRSSRRHCVGGAPVLAGLDVELLVRREDLVLVTRTTAVMDYSDGTGSALLSGVPLVPIDGASVFGYPTFEGYADGLRFTIGLPRAPVALGYEPLRVGSTRDRTHALEPGASGELGRTGAGRVSQASAPEQGPRPPAWVTPFGEGESGPTGVLVGGTCAEHRVAVSQDRLGPLPELEDIKLEGGDEPPPPAGPLLRVGVPLYWPDGQIAGVVTRPRTLLTPGTSQGLTRCFNLLAEAQASRGMPPEGGGGASICAEEELLAPAP